MRGVSSPPCPTTGKISLGQGSTTVSNITEQSLSQPGSPEWRSGARGSVGKSRNNPDSVNFWSEDVNKADT